MDTYEKIKLTSFNLPFEAADEAKVPISKPFFNENLVTLKTQFPVTWAHLPNGQTIPLLKTMLTSVCEKDCNYCCFRSGRDTPRANLTPDELASAIDMLTRAGLAKGLFLSSGLAGGGVRTQDRLIATAEILRKKFNYQEYMHLKIMPGAEKDQVFQAMKLADRVSINMEAPNETTLRKLAPHKSFYTEPLAPLKMIEEIRQTQPANLAWKGRWPSSCTQFVVGAVGEKDIDILHTTAKLRQEYKITRAYYSKFTPVINTPFENLPPTSPLRQYRLYQASFLLHNYNFDCEELPFTPEGNLHLDVDPKLLWAERNLIPSPLEINTSNYSQFIKVPGIGPQSAKKILQARTYGIIGDIHVLQKMGVAISRASKFILLNGRRPNFQPNLFEQRS
jgi:predicted DNA-binding helix-hairpin-helix protein